MSRREAEGLLFGKPEGVLDSQVPPRIATPDAPAKKEATDLDLVPAGSDALAPDAAPTRLVWPTESADGITVGNLTVTPAGSAEVARVDSDTVASPSIATDTDLVVNPTATGIETFDQLRRPSAASPNQHLAWRGAAPNSVPPISRHSDGQ